MATCYGQRILVQSITNRFNYPCPALLKARIINPSKLDCRQFDRSYCSAASVNKISRRIYPRMYRGIIVNSDGSTIRSRLMKPYHVVQLPFDLNQLSERERQLRLKKFEDQKEIVYEDMLSGEEFDFESVTKLVTENKDSQ